jgi:NTP pyrophosphatase (non-canonical NTP hydrolase)
MTTIEELTDLVLRYRDERQWQKIHSIPKLAAALAVESGELLELTLWRDEEEVKRLLSTGDGRAAAAAELADILTLTLTLAADLQIDLAAALREKLRADEVKYPPEEARGRALKRPDNVGAETDIEAETE